jgi:transposase
MSRGSKTDPVDARLIAEILRLEEVPTSHVPDAAVQGLRELTRLRADLVTQISDINHRVVTMLDRVFPEFATCFRDVCGLTGCAILEAWALPEEIAPMPTAQLSPLIARVSHGRFGADTARAVQEAAQHSVGIRRGADALAFELRLLLRQVGYVDRRVVDLDQEIGRPCKALDVYLLTIPRLCPATAPAIYAEIGHI